jgi:outer membrane immunogenic protein
MRTAIFALVAATALSTPALAEPFSGPYVGVEVGLDNYEGKGSDVFAPGDRFNGISGNGIVGGAYAGFDMPVSGNFFAGVEANASLSGAKATYDDTADRLTIKAKESFGASARLGLMVNDSTGAYARAGWQNTKFRADLNGVRDSDRDDALVLGGGIETRVGSNASIRVEYNHANYDDFIKNNTVRAGLGFRF